MRVAQGHIRDVIKTFGVDNGFLEYLRRCAVDLDRTSDHPDRPQVVDKAYPDQYGIRPSQFAGLLRNIVPGTGGVL